MRNEEWDDFSARLNCHLRSKSYESITTSEMMNIIWQELRSKATDETLKRPLRTRDVASILKLRFDLSAGEIDLERVLEEMMPPEQGAIPAFESQETQDEIFVIGRTFVKKARS